MSVKIMTKVWESDVEHNQMMILLAMADWADDFGGSIFPSVSRLAWKTGFSVRQTQRILGALRNTGILSIEGVAASGQNIYRLHVSNLAPKPAFEGDAKCSTSLRTQTIERFNQTCHWCRGVGDNVNGPDATAWNIDRLLPGSKGGKYALDNVVLSCGICNRKRYNSGGAVLSGGANKGDGGVPFELEGGAITASHNPSVEPSVEPSVSLMAGFDEFWKEYPKKVARRAAEKAWAKMKADAALRIRIMQSLQVQKGSWDWRKENGKFIPFPASWLNGRRWEDVVTAGVSQPSKRSEMIGYETVWHGIIDRLARGFLSGDTFEPEFLSKQFRDAMQYAKPLEVANYLVAVMGQAPPGWLNLLGSVVPGEGKAA